MQILNLHVSPEPVAAASLTDGANLNIATGDDLNVTVSDGRITFTTPDGVSNATVTTADIMTCKSYVHIIDSVLLTGGLVSPESAHADGITRGVDGKYAVCSGQWGEMAGPAACGISVSNNGTVEVGEFFGGFNGYFSEEAGDGEDEGCFKQSIAEIFSQPLCKFEQAIGGQTDVIECLPPADGKVCVCLAPFGQRITDEQSGRNWPGNIGFNSFLQRLRSRARPIKHDFIEFADNGGRMENQLKVEETLTGMLSVTDCS